tara:strand:- start:1580 stop:1840 length:261 start_codon:yes stop_codon:yes gene_type:complete
MNMSKFKNIIRKIFNFEVYEEGYIYIILKGTEYTKYSNKYSEGVFAWYQSDNDSLNMSEDFQILNGGDPIVLKKYLLKQKSINRSK